MSMSDSGIAAFSGIVRTHSLHLSTQLSAQLSGVSPSCGCLGSCTYVQIPSANPPEKEHIILPGVPKKAPEWSCTGSDCSPWVMIPSLNHSLLLGDMMFGVVRTESRAHCWLIHMGQEWVGVFLEKELDCHCQGGRK